MPYGVFEHAIERSQVRPPTTGCSTVMQLSDQISITHRRLFKRVVNCARIQQNGFYWTVRRAGAVNKGAQSKNLGVVPP